MTVRAGPTRRLKAATSTLALVGTVLIGTPEAVSQPVIGEPLPFKLLYLALVNEFDYGYHENGNPDATTYGVGIAVDFAMGFLYHQDFGARIEQDISATRTVARFVKDAKLAYHFAGHGNGEAIVFQDGAGSRQWSYFTKSDDVEQDYWEEGEEAYSVSRLVFNPRLRLVVLQGCETAVGGLSDSVAGAFQGPPGAGAAASLGFLGCVAAGPRPNTDSPAQTWSRQLWANLAVGDTVTEAADRAAEAVLQHKGNYYGYDTFIIFGDSDLRF